MIRHIVMFKMKESAEGAGREENVQRVKSRLEALTGKIPEIRYFELGKNVIDSAAAYDLVLVSEFEDPESLVSYQRHPEHQKVFELVQKVCENRAVVDYSL
jgi:hypothetical protein